jgi:catecholate siderophore receptor
VSRIPETGSADAPAPAFLALGCVGLFAALSSPAQAADAADAPSPDPVSKEERARLNEIIVRGQSVTDGSYKADSSASVKLTAPLIDTPRSVTIIPAQVIKDTASASLTEALRTVPGIALGAGEGGNPLGDRPFIRGFDSQASTYLDGVRDIGAQSREVFDIEQIEVIKGSDGAFAGRGSAGGTINLISKMPKLGSFVAGSATLGTADYKRVTIDANYQLGEMVAFRINGMWHDQDVAGRDAIWQKRWGIAPSLAIGLGTPTRLTLSYYHLQTNELPDSGIPYLYTAANVPAGITETKPAGDYTTIGGQQVHTPRSAFYGLKDRDFRKSRIDQATMIAEHEFGPDFLLRNTARYAHTTQDYIYTQPDDQQGNVYGTSATSTNPGQREGYVWRRANTRFGSTEGLLDQVDLTGSFDTFGLGHSFAAGGELSWESAVQGTYVLATGSTLSPRCTPATINRYYCTTVGNPNPNDPWVNTTSDTSGTRTPIVRGAPGTTTLTDTSTKAAYAFDTISIGKALLVNLGARYDDYGTRVRQPIVGGARPQLRRHDGIFTWQGAAIFKPTKESSVYVSYATAATPPGTFLGQSSEGNGLTTVGVNPNDLKVEKTRSYEVGAKLNLFHERLALTLAGFRTLTHNARTTGEAGTVVFVGERKIKGIEFGFNGAITPRWNVFGGYTYMDARIVDGGFTVTTVGTTSIAAPSVNTGKRFPNTPRSSFTGFTTYKLLPALSFGGGAIYMGKVYGGYSDTRTITNGQLVITRPLARYVPGYWRFDANAAYSFTKDIALRANVLNLTNKRYFDKAYTAHYANQAAGRTALFTLDVKY